MLFGKESVRISAAVDLKRVQRQYLQLLKRLMPVKKKKTIMLLLGQLGRCPENKGPTVKG